MDEKQRGLAILTYNLAIWDGDPKPIKAVTDALACSRATAHRLITAARAEGKIRTLPEGHRPRTARWSDSTSSWRACQNCKTPWPCDAATSRVR